MSRKKKPRQEPETLELPSGGVDTHAHLDLEAFEGRVDETLDRAAACGVSRVGQVFLGPEAYERGRALFANRPEVFFIVGVHPHDAKSWDASVADALRRAAAEDPRVKALGEMGLDHYYDYSTPAEQRAAFSAQLDLARELDRPVVIHSRDALDETFEVLDAAGVPEGRLLWHCFGGDASMAARILERGWMLSVPGSVSWSKMDALREAVADAPLDRLVLETDCPFLAPDPWRGKRNEPAFVGFTARAVARAKGLEPAEVWRAAAANAARFFGLD